MSPGPPAAPRPSARPALSWTAGQDLALSGMDSSSNPPAVSFETLASPSPSLSSGCFISGKGEEKHSGPRCGEGWMAHVKLPAPRLALSGRSKTVSPVLSQPPAPTCRAPRGARREGGAVPASISGESFSKLGTSLTHTLGTAQLSDRPGFWPRSQPASRVPSSGAGGSLDTNVHSTGSLVSPGSGDRRHVTGQHIGASW